MSGSNACKSEARSAAGTGGGRLNHRRRKRIGGLDRAN
jgi:hypothetical protein